MKKLSKRIKFNIKLNLPLFTKIEFSYESGKITKSNEEDKKSYFEA